MYTHLSKGFTLIELIIVVAIIGILSAIAVPLYATYTAKTYITEGMSLAASAKSAMVDYYSLHGAFMYKAAAWGNQKFELNKEYGIDDGESFAHNAVERIMIGSWWAPFGITITYSGKKLGIASENPTNDEKNKPRIILIPSPSVTSQKYILSNGGRWTGGAISWQCYYIQMPSKIAPSICQKADRDFSSCQGTGNNC